MSEPVATLDPRFSDPHAEATPWAVTRVALEAAELAWVVTLRRDGRPHATPVVPVWVDDAFHFTTGDSEQKAANLRADDRVLVQVGRLDWERGLDIVVEGTASPVSDPALLSRLAAAWRARWRGQWAFEARGDRLHHPAGFPVLAYSVRPQRVLAFAEGTFGHTSYRFPQSSRRSG
jgi:nitroimidazol reductase NimA-like FMN-containing flavoprotein (pyridoxamine 5'-phosphate oxidase superfamily)